MTYPPMKIRPAMTAIAAVIGLSSTPSFAQSVDTPAAETPAPVTETTSAPIVADDPLAPAPTADTTTTADPLAPEATAKPVARKATPAKTTATRSRPAPARLASAAPAVAAAPAASLAPADITPAEPPLPVQPEAAPVAAPVAEPPATAETTTMAINEDVLPIAAAGGIGLLALAGAGLAVRRRRRRREEVEFEARQEYAESLAPALAEAGEIAAPQRATMEPTFVRAFAPAPQPTGPTSKPAVANQAEGDFMLRRAGTKPSVEPAFSK